MLTTPRRDTFLPLEYSGDFRNDIQWFDARVTFRFVNHRVVCVVLSMMEIYKPIICQGSVLGFKTTLQRGYRV